MVSISLGRERSNKVVESCKRLVNVTKSKFGFEAYLPCVLM